MVDTKRLAAQDAADGNDGAADDQAWLQPISVTSSSPSPLSAAASAESPSTSASATTSAAPAASPPAAAAATSATPAATSGASSATTRPSSLLGQKLRSAVRTIAAVATVAQTRDQWLRGGASTSSATTRWYV